MTKSKEDLVLFFYFLSNPFQWTKHLTRLVSRNPLLPAVASYAHGGARGRVLEICWIRYETYLIPGETLIPGGKGEGKSFTLVLDMPHNYVGYGMWLT